MINYLAKIISLNNLRKNKPSAQIATLLMLVMVVALIFILMTVNLGQTSLQATNLANVADSCSLYLASQLATYAHYYWLKIPGYGYCKKGSFISTILMVVLAIVAIVLAVPTGGASIGFFAACAANAGTVIAAGMIGGMVGGALGGALTEGTIKAALGGAIQGAGVGAAIGAALVSFGSFTAAGPGQLAPAGSVAGSGGAEVAVPVAAEETGMSLIEPAITAGETGMSIGEPAIAAGGAGMSIGEPTVSLAISTISPGALMPVGSLLISGSAVMGSTIGALTGIGLSAGGSLYNSYTIDRMNAAALRTIAEQLSALPNDLRIREGVFFQALSQTVDDPDTIPDYTDFDNDGDTQEEVPYFSSWWSARIEVMKNKTPDLTALVRQFIKGPLTDFQDFAEAETKVIRFQSSHGRTESKNGSLCREEVEGADGKIVKWARAMEDAGYEISFWKPGTSFSDPESAETLTDDTSCTDSSCDDATADNYNDEVEDVSTDLKKIAITAKTYTSKTDEEIKEVALNWENWISDFYQPDDEFGCYYDLQDLIYGNSAELKGLYAWKDEIITKRLLLPECLECTAGEDKGKVSNPPCRIEGDIEHPYAGSIDSDFNDEFTPTLQSINELINKIDAFSLAIKDFYEDLERVKNDIDTIAGQGNPVTYSWSDSRGDHSIKVEVGPFIIPHVATYKRRRDVRKKVCVELRAHSDDGSRTWVEITRKDPANKDMGILGRWNPFSSGEIKRRSKAYFNVNAVGIAGVK